MFSTKKRLIEKTGFNDLGRYDYLKLLCTEFKTTESSDDKQQILANLANFAYDPVNYDYIRRLCIIDLFMHVLSEGDSILVRFAIGGICNLCSDPINKEYILRNRGIQLITPLLNSSDEETLLSAITTLMFMTTKVTKTEIFTFSIIEKLKNLSNSSNNRLKNLSIIFLNDHLSSETQY